MQRIVVVGGGLAGARAIEALRNQGFDGHVTLVGAEPHLPYERPPLSKELLLGSKDAHELSVLPADFYAEHDVELQLGTTATGVDPRAGRIELDDGSSLAADRILLCTGTRPRKLPVAGTSLEGVHYLRTLEDALAIQSELASGAQVVVIGGGFIGAELAATARSLGNAVTMVELDRTPMSRALGETIGERLTALHRDKGVVVHTGVGVERISGDSRVRSVSTSDGLTIDADVVVIGVGVEPVVDLATRSGIAVDNGILIDEFCRTSQPHVYAAGDVANHPNALLDRRVRLEHWQNAQNQGIAAARSMLGHEEPYREVPWFWSNQFDTNIQVAGHPSPSDDIVWRGDPGTDQFTALFLKSGVLRAAVGVNRPRDVRGALNLIAQGATPDVRLAADLSVDLRMTARPAA